MAELGYGTWPLSLQKDKQLHREPGTKTALGEPWNLHKKLQQHSATKKHETLHWAGRLASFCLHLPISQACIAQFQEVPSQGKELGWVTVSLAFWGTTQKSHLGLTPPKVQCSYDILIETARRKEEWPGVSIQISYAMRATVAGTSWPPLPGTPCRFHPFSPLREGLPWPQFPKIHRLSTYLEIHKYFQCEWNLYCA